MIVKIEMIATGLCLLEEFYVCGAAKGAFERKRVARFQATLHFMDEESACGDCKFLWNEC